MGLSLEKKKMLVCKGSKFTQICICFLPKSILYTPFKVVGRDDGKVGTHNLGDLGEAMCPGEVPPWLRAEEEN